MSAFSHYHDSSIENENVLNIITFLKSPYQNQDGATLYAASRSLTVLSKCMALKSSKVGRGIWGSFFGCLYLGGPLVIDKTKLSLHPFPTNHTSYPIPHHFKAKPYSSMTQSTVSLS